MKKKTHRHPDNGGNKRAKRWLGSYDDPDGNEVSKAFRTRAAADKWGKAREAEVERGEWIDPRAGKTLVRAEGQKWLRLRRGGYGTRARYTSVWHNHVEPAFGERPVKSIKPSELAEYFQGLALTHGYPTQQAARIVLMGLFDQAAADGARRDNPMRSPIVPKPRKVEKERPSWPVGRIWAVTQACSEPYRTIPPVSAGLGTRPSEGFALAIEDFDFDAGTVHIQRQVIRAGKLLVPAFAHGVGCVWRLGDG